MDNLSFCYWLHGLFELSSPTSLNSTQIQEIKNHIKLVKEGQNPLAKAVEYYKNPETWAKTEPTYCSSVEDLFLLTGEWQPLIMNISC